MNEERKRQPITLQEYSALFEICLSDRDICQRAGVKDYSSMDFADMDRVKGYLDTYYFVRDEDEG